MDLRIKKEMNEWIKNYNINNNNEDYKLCCELSYKWNVKNEKVCRKYVGYLKKYLNKHNIEIDGFVVSEYDKNVTNLHNHLLLWSNVNYSVLGSKIYGYWKNIGRLEFREYNKDENYSGYILKYLGRENGNDWDLLYNY